MSTQHHIARVRNAILAMSLVMATIVVAHPAVVSAGSMQGTIVPSPNQPMPVWNIVSSPNTSTTTTNQLLGVTCTSSSNCLGVGFADSGTIYDTLAEQYNGTSWSIVSSPNSVDSNQLLGVGCASSSECWAVGWYYTGSFYQTLIEEWNGASWSIISAPNVSTTESSALYSVSCASTSECWAVGYGDNGSGIYTLIEEWNGTSWNIVSSPNVSTTTSDYLYGVTCVSSSDCWAVGDYNTGSTAPSQTLVEEWNGTSWSIISSPNTSTTEGNDLQSVSCVSSSFCVAAGYYINSVDQTLIEEWNGASWSIISSPNTSTTEGNDLQSVSCASSSDCWAVGGATPPGGTALQTLTLEWNGASWNIAASQDTTGAQTNQLYGVTCGGIAECWAVGYAYPSGSSYQQTLVERQYPMQNNYLFRVSCTSTSFCMAAGHYYTGNYDQTLIEEWNGSSWSILSSPNTSTTESNDFWGVSCTSTSFCFAVGNYINGGGYEQTLVEEWNGTSWSIVTSPDTSTTESNLFDRVSCASTTFCMATGYYCTDGSTCSAYEQTLAEEWNGTSWSIVPSPDTSTTENNRLYSVSCTSTTFCMAEGFYNTGSYDQTLAEEWNGTSWSIISSPNTSTTQSNLIYGVSCTSTTFCMATGYYCTDGSTCSAYEQALIEEWNGSAWSIVTAANTSTTQNNLLSDVSCTSTTFCMAEGLYNTGSYDQTLAQEWNGTSWSLVTSPDTSTTQSNLVTSMSCTGTSFCIAVGYFINSAGYGQTLIEQFAMVCSGGALSLNIPSAAAFPAVTLNGTNQTILLTLTVNPDDETGTGNGWNIDVTSTTFVNANGDTLPATASTVTGVASVSNPTGNCIPPTNTVTYSPPIPIPAGATAPAAVPIYSANTGTGEGPSNVALNFAVAVPANTYSGTYTSIWTFTIASGP